jgi:hypothetical protein
MASQHHDPQAVEVNRILDTEAVRQLAARYVASIDKGWRPETFDPNAFDGIFAPDAVYEMPDLGAVVSGLEAIKASLAAETQQLAFSHHSLTDPVICIDDDEASSQWKMWIVATHDGGTRLVLGRLQMTCQRRDARWRVSRAVVWIGSTVVLGGDGMLLP